MFTLRRHEEKKPAEERRRAPRLALRQPVKLYCGDTGRFLAGATANVSTGGALLEVAHPSLLVAGQSVQVGIAWSKQQAVISRQNMIDATVVRSLGHGGVQTVAVAFAHDQSLPQLAATA